VDKQTWDTPDEKWKAVVDLGVTSGTDFER